MDDDAARHAVAAGQDPADPDLVADRRGNRSLVLVHRRRGLVWRFPLWAKDMPAYPAVVARARAAHDLGYPAPAVLDAVVDAPLGQAYMVLTYVPGLAMDDPRVLALDGARLDRLGHDLGRLLLHLRAQDRSAWPVPCPAWADLWAGMAERARAAILPMLDDASARRAGAELDAAVAAARVTTTGLVHGDLGGVNVRVDPETGAMTGVLDWDGAHLGDGGVDVAAVAAGAPPRVVDAVLSASPLLVDDLARHDLYLATWAVQGALWGLENGDDETLRDGLLRCRNAAVGPVDR